MANLNENLTKYLDYNGLGQFLAKLKEYIADRISEVNGTNLHLNASGTNNPTITSQINDLWEAIDDTAINEKFESINNYTINGKKISTSPTLTGDDITLGKSVGDNTNYPTTMDIPEAIQKLRETITGLGKVVNLSGVYEKWEDYTSEPNNGDFVIVGQKEYVYWDKWIELGDTTQVTQYLNELIAKYNTHTHTFSVSGSVQSSFTGTAESHGHTFTGNSVETTNNTLSVSYSAGKLTINTSHKHTVTPTGTISNTSLTPKGTITSSFSGNGVSSETNSTQSLPPIEPGAPDNFNPGGGGNPDSGETVIDYSKEQFTIEALEDGLTVQLSQNACEYRIDNGEWVTLSANSNTPSVNKGQKISFKITNPTISSTYGIGAFTVSKIFNVEGNIMSLLYGDNFEGQTDLSDKNYAFYKLFNNCITLQNTENLILPATTLTKGCYQYMFKSCTGLTTAPALPATILVDSCYQYMFSDCTSLTTAPELPATALAGDCYGNMFNKCTSLTTAPELPATALVKGCYGNMFKGCTSLTTAPELPATALEEMCYYNMFYGCTSLTTAPELPATTLVKGCYGNMFYKCTSLTTAPELPSETLAERCYYNMFSGCSTLNYIKMLATDISANNCLYNWVKDVASSGTFVKHPDMTTLPSGISGIPSGWTVVNDGEESGGLVFPVTLESGDNGDIGISLYSYLQNTYGEPASVISLNGEIINVPNYNGVSFNINTISYATWMGFTGYWLNGRNQYMTSWVLLENGYLQRVDLSQD